MGTLSLKPGRVESLPGSSPEPQDISATLPHLPESSLIQSLLDHAIEHGAINTAITVYRKTDVPKNIITRATHSARPKPDHLIRKIIRAQTRAFIHTAPPAEQKTKPPSSLADRLLGLRKGT